MAIQGLKAVSHFGFVDEGIGAHGGRTIMLSELRLLLAACKPYATLEEYRSAILDENILLKKTDSTRRESFRRLRELYALNHETLLFRTMRYLWNEDSEAQPLLAMLCANTRDPILRQTGHFILPLSSGTPVTPVKISEFIHESFPDRFNSMTLGNLGRHIASSWQQSGHLSGRVNKVRSKAASRPAAIAYALLLGYLCDMRGAGLFDTYWSRLLDAPLHVLQEQAIAASQRGLIEYRHTGGVTEISFRQLLEEGEVPKQ